MINKVILVGNLGRDPEVRSTQGGSSVCRLRIATTERQKDRDGNWSDHTEWHTVVCFGQAADACVRFLQKGRQVYVEGKLRTSKWQDKDGQDRYTTEIIAFEVKFLGGQGSRDDDRGGRDDGDRGNRRDEPDRGREQPRGGNSRAPARSSAPAGRAQGGDDSIPF